MCFSAPVSFGAGILLSAIGIATVKKTTSRKQLMFAFIPVLFAVQQFTEGFVWLSMTNPDFISIRDPATYMFLFIAQVVWPFWVPFSILILEPGKQRKKLDIILVFLGSAVSLYLFYCLVNFPVQSEILGYHISYIQSYPESISLYFGSLYVISTIGPPFFSGFKKMWTLGVTILISYIITTIFYNDYIVSVWCFFAAIISATIYIILIVPENLHYKVSENTVGEGAL